MLKLCACMLSHSHVSDSCNFMHCRLPGSTVHGVFQARILERVAISYSRESSQLRDQTPASHFLHWQVDSLPLHQLGSLILKLTIAKHTLYSRTVLLSSMSLHQTYWYAHIHIQCVFILFKLITWTWLEILLLCMLPGVWAKLSSRSLIWRSSVKREKALGLPIVDAFSILFLEQSNGINMCSALTSVKFW